MKVLVTGGAGFIGSHTVVELDNAGHTPIVVDNLSNSNQRIYDGISKILGKSIVHLKIDVLDTESLIRVINKYRCESVIHFAAYKAVGESVEKPLKYYRNNVGGIISVLEAMRATGIKDLIFSSSTTVYGDPDNLPIKETDPIKPATNPYGASKQMSEKIIEDTCNFLGMNSVLLRYFNPIGAHPSAHMGELPIGKPNCLVPYITQATAGRISPLTVFGDDYDTPDGSAIRDYIHVVDLAKAHVKAMQYLEKADKKVEVFNLGMGRGVSVFEIIEAFENANKVQVPYKLGGRRKGDVAATYSDISKAKKLLDWKPELSVSEALKDAWRWQKNLV